MTRSLPVLLLVLVLALAGCGGDEDGDEAAPPAEPAPAETAEREEPAEPGEETAAGEAIFVENCGGCHTLSAAGTSGTVGPSFDEFSPSAESVEVQVRRGGGGMPSFEGTLSDEEIQAVSEYVAANAGG